MTPTSEARRPTPNSLFVGPWWTLVAALLLDVGGMLPVMLVGALAPDLIAQLNLTTSNIAVIVASFFAFGAITAMTLGSRLDHFGVQRVCLVTGSMSVVLLILIGLFARNTVGFVIATALSGATLAMTMPASNAVMVHAAPVARRALAISIKQSGVALALLVSGLLFPIVRGHLPWQSAFFSVTIIGVIGVLLLARQHIVAPPRSQSGTRLKVRRSVIWIGVAVGLASIIPGALTGFASLTLVTTGVSAAAVAVLFAGANVLGIGVRILSGWAADRSMINVGYSVAALMILGAVGALMLATPVELLASAGIIAAFAFGWGWTGLTYFLIVMNREGDAGSVSAVAQSGGMSGTAAGPILMGISISLVGIYGAWIVVSVIGVGAGLLVVFMTRRTQRSQGVAVDD